MVNLLLVLLKGILGMKFGWLIVIIAGIIIGGSLIKNVISGSFSIGKFASGFNPFLGGVQGKLIYYGLLITLALAIYHQITRPTTDYDTNYKNQIHHNRDIAVDQRVGATCIPTKILWGLIQIGCNSEAMQQKNINNNCDCQKK